ncbi:MAG TPA: Spy/CpxP family protein refolding chaperone, partial [Coleofasciculaceae cyanobacterium]
DRFLRWNYRKPKRFHSHLTPLNKMKFNFKTSLVCGAVIGAIALIPFMAKAQSPSTSQGGRLQHAMEQLNLSPDQKSQLSQIRQSTRTQLENLLTAEQQQQLQAALAQGEPLPAAIASLNLTAAQRTQAEEILKASHDQVQTILTPEQQQQLRELRQSHRAGRHGLLGEMPPELAQRLNLTEDQQAQLKQIRENTRNQVENVLTAEQQQQLQAAIAQGQERPEAFRALNLTEAQRIQRHDILKAARQQAKAVLTAEQQQQIRDFMQSHRSQLPQ